MKLLRWRLVDGADLERLRSDRADAINGCLNWMGRYKDANEQHAAVARALHAALKTGPSVADAAIVLIGQRSDMTAEQKEDAISTIKLWRAI